MMVLFFRILPFNSLYDPFDSPCRGQKPFWQRKVYAPPVPPQREGSLIPNQAFPLTIKGKDVAGDAPTLPEFWYRQRSLYPQGVADKYLRNRVAIIGRNRIANV